MEISEHKSKISEIKHLLGGVLQQSGDNRAVYEFENRSIEIIQTEEPEPQGPVGQQQKI